MVHQHQVGIHRASLGGKGRALVVMRALFAEAGLRGARHLGPEDAIAALAERIALVHVAGFSRVDPRHDRHKGISFVTEQQVLRSLHDFFELAETQVVFAALQNGRLQLAVEQACHQRNVLAPELFLQRAGRRTDDDAFARHRLASSRNQIGQRLSRTRRRFQNTETALVHVAFHHRGEILLVVAHLEIFNLRRKEPTLLKKLAHAGGALLDRRIFKRDIRQLELRKLRSILRFAPYKRPVRTPGNSCENIHEPRVRIRNLVERHHEKVTAGFGIGERTVRTAAFNAQLLHQGIEAVVRHILVSNARNRQ